MDDSGLVGEGLVVRIGRFPFQTALGAWPAIGTHPWYESPSNLWVENAKRNDEQWVTEAVLLIKVQSWPWENQIAVGK